MLPLARLLAGSSMRMPLCCMKAMVSQSILSGRGGRSGGGPVGFSKGTVLAFSGIGGLEYCGRRTGREIEKLRPCKSTKDERDVREEFRAEGSGEGVRRRV